MADYIPDSSMPLAMQLYQQAIGMGANPTLASYLVGSAYQESSFNPAERDDFVKGQPTSLGLMQVGSPALARGSVTDQFGNYITALQRQAPHTWAAMNAASTPEEAYAAQHQNPDWRMGIPGSRFDYANQVLGQTGSQALQRYGDIALAGVPGMTSASMVPLALLSPQQGGGPMSGAMLAQSGYSGGTAANPGAMSSVADYAKALTTPSMGQQVAGGIAGFGQALAQSGQRAVQGNNAALQQMNQPNPMMQWLQMLAANPMAGYYPQQQA